MPDSLLGRMFANTVWLLGGKGFGAICSLLYLAILTRSLGLKGFGHFSLIFGTAQALIAIAGFQTWRVVVRYGAEHVHAKNWDAFGRLGMLCGVLDAIGAVMGCGIAWVVFYQFSDALDLNKSLVDTAFWFNVAAIWALVSAPTGIVRALDRFDVAVYVEAVVPIGRLAAATAIWLTDPTLMKFLIAWAVIDLLEAAAYWIMARYLAPQSVGFRHLRHWRLALSENEGIIRFFGITYANATLEAAKRNGPLLAVGFFAGTKAAGLYRLAQQLSQGLSKLSTLLTRSVYAEIARARVAAQADEFRKLAMQTSLIAGLAGALVVAIALIVGKQLMGLIGGDAFRAGYAVMVPLTIAASFELASVAFEPVLHSTGRARHALLAQAAALTALVIALLALVHPFEAVGIAWAVAIGGAVFYLSMGGMAHRALRLLAKGHI
ncbi:lipopolysaccharide biosynthesis protein [Croceicoccus estronivorus]|uniref:lipopolysaccharide biosynthesis protein n=1 Tax=Croceicoccus estronivorus TaxID=1172626 RepID=UPI000A4FF612|nr:lipopolysaccharide biosynthesis protein [Croceicoccus estronivorus]